ncbi:MarR family transcriptional regulator [Armatimonas rosea]|uniref:Uncharacterized protein n=1 Tax=Armatimonas rosea TaxID=685828 RepID=A0A7W9W6Q2_ARMRO|nr:MarR family transcriptional regulator [Armatimonas rosea]MBB6050416.1 hypothetical protein [Armatimonas rosea]
MNKNEPIYIESILMENNPRYFYAAEAFLKSENMKESLFLSREFEINECFSRYEIDNDYRDDINVYVQKQKIQYEDMYTRICNSYKNGEDFLEIASSECKKINASHLTSFCEFKKCYGNIFNEVDMLDDKKNYVFMLKYTTQLIESLFLAYMMLSLMNAHKSGDSVSDVTLYLNDDEDPVFRLMKFDYYIKYKYNIRMLVYMRKIFNNISPEGWVYAVYELDKKLWDVYYEVSIEEWRDIRDCFRAAMVATVWTASKKMRKEVWNALADQTQGQGMREILHEILMTAVAYVDIDRSGEFIAGRLPSRILDKIRSAFRTKRKREVEMSDDIEDLVACEPSPASVLNLESLLPKLTPSQRRLIEAMVQLSDSGEKLTHANIARLTGRSQQAVSAMLERIQIALQVDEKKKKLLE